MRVPSIFRLLFLFTTTFAIAQPAVVPAPSSNPFHDTLEWKSIEAHLPNPRTATHEKLETAADVLRARKYDEDALEYYQYAILRGGDKGRLLNRIGLVQLELNDHRAARLSFQQALKIRKKFPEVWNNIGTLDYLDGHYGNAISSYKKAIKDDKKSAVYHANLGSTYFAQKDPESAQKEFALALKLDPDLYNHRDRGGFAAQILSAQDRARFNFELAKVYAKQDDRKSMYLYLAKAAEGGMDVADAVQEDRAFFKYLKEPQLTLMLKDTRAFLMAIESPAPTLPEQTTAPAQ